MAIKEFVKSVAPEHVLNLLQQLMHDQQFNKFYLVGGTSLALRLGHRMSIDIDLFVHMARNQADNHSIVEDVNRPAKNRDLLMRSTAK
ncbi:MAG: nucleotidyl transferase AbiEii/AbiGii toxin family protein [Desulfobacterales bacterium]|nr:nucleotidyl transferase AbiEii/AbiGii toxin family protein [Desulfobacterales bacterium]